MNTVRILNTGDRAIIVYQHIIYPQNYIDVREDIADSLREILPHSIKCTLLRSATGAAVQPTQKTNKRKVIEND